ncbi:MAG: PssD/Cps14F family polysaccharide biosynthesis glycosyltransferase [Methanobacterium sp.]
MKIALISSYGGHLNEIMQIVDVFKSYDYFFITYDNFRTRGMNEEKHLMDNIGKNPIKMIKAFIKFYSIYRNERPDVIVSTGSEIAIPAFILAKIMGIRSVYIETWCRVKTRSGTGKIVYYFSDIFLVQWPDLLDLYGPKAQYYGGVI